MGRRWSSKRQSRFCWWCEHFTLNEYRKDFEEKREKDPTYIWEEKVINLSYGTKKKSEFSENTTDEDINK